MSLAQKIADVQASTTPSFDIWVDRLAEADRAALIEAANDPALTNAAILTAIREEGGRVSKDTFAVWRKAQNVAR